MSDRRQELLRAILDRPNDDDLRLVYADVVAEDGDTAHAELIQTQIQLARATLTTTNEHKEQLRARAAAIEAEHGRRLAGPIAQHASKWWFDRGLVSQIKAPLTVLAAHGDALLGHAPVHTLVLDSDDDDDVAWDDLQRRLHNAALVVAQCPHLARVSEIDAAMESAFSNDDEDGNAFIAFLTSPHLGSLERLYLDAYCRPFMAPAIAEAHARLPALRELVIGSPSGTDVGDEGVIALATTAPALCERLETLELWGAGIGGAGIAALAPVLQSTRRLILGPVWYAQNEVGVAGARALASAPFPRLEYLDLAGNRIRDDGVEVLATSASWLPHLRHLDLSDNGLTDAGLIALARSPNATSLERLRLAKQTHGGARSSINQFTANGLRALERLPHLREISFVEEDSWIAMPLSDESISLALEPYSGDVDDRSKIDVHAPRRLL